MPWCPLIFKKLSKFHTFCAFSRILQNLLHFRVLVIVFVHFMIVLKFDNFVYSYEIEKKIAFLCGWQNFIVYAYFLCYWHYSMIFLYFHEVKKFHVFQELTEIHEFGSFSWTCVIERYWSLFCTGWERKELDGWN